MGSSSCTGADAAAPSLDDDGEGDESGVADSDGPDDDVIATISDALPGHGGKSDIDFLVDGGRHFFRAKNRRFDMDEFVRNAAIVLI